MSEMLNFRIEPEMMDALKEFAERKDLTVSDAARMAIANLLGFKQIEQKRTTVVYKWVKK